MRRLASLPIAFLATAALAADGPLDKLTPAKAGNSVCWVRSYSDAHLAEHPGQETLAALLSWRYEPPEALVTVRFELQFRGARRLDFLGSCSWNEAANIDTSGKRILATFKGKAGYDCLGVRDPSSAEESGYFVLEPRDGGKTVLVHVDTPMSTADTASAPSARVDFGVEDRVFKLTRTDPADCARLDAALPPL